MISFLKGTVDNITESTVELDVNGTGFEIQISPATAERLEAVGDQVTVYTYTYIREDQLALYGFSSRDELALFKKLITVSGIGPKAGLSLLSVMNADDLRFAIVAGDVKSISRAPGVGKRTAERLVLELRDKLDSIVLPASELSGTEAIGAKGEGLSSDAADAVDALTALGYSRVDAMKAVKRAAEAGAAGTEELLKKALGSMV
ncbi:MAG: Holliday junction branch migration protein RuvA [Lachnospiraceae bacterium]